MWIWPLAHVAHDLSAVRWGCDLFSRHRFCDRIARNVAQRNFAQRYLRAPFIDINRRSSRCASLLQLDYDEIIRALNGFAMPDFPALQTPTIQIESARVRFRMAGT